MKRIFIDPNILLDLVMKRHSFYQEAKRLFDYCDQRNIKTYISAISIATINYLLSKSYRKDEVKRILEIIYDITEILPFYRNYFYSSSF